MGQGIATTADQRITEIRNAGVRLTVALLLDGDVEQAVHTLIASVMHQARLDGIGV